jgi:hypothetical protein
METTVELGFVLDQVEALDVRTYDGARIERDQPQLYRLLWTLLAMGASPSSLRAKTKMDIRTIMAVRERAESQGLITPFRQDLVRKLDAVILVGVDELLDKAAAGKLTALDLKLLIEIRELLTGNATVRVVHTEDPAVAEYRRTVAMRAGGMGLEGKKTAAIGAGAGAGLVVDAEITGHAQCPDDDDVTPDNATHDV